MMLIQPLWKAIQHWPYRARCPVSRVRPSAGGGFFSGLRSQISYNETLSSAPKGNGKIRLKLFNLVVKELGPTFLERGVWIDPKQLQDFISENADQLTKGCLSAKIDGQDIESTEVANIDFSSMMVQLQVTTV